MHSIDLTPALQTALQKINCWELQCVDVQRIASLIIGDFPVPLLRTKGMKAIAAGRTYCSEATELHREFLHLGRQCVEILNTNQTTIIVAAAHFYLRLQKIHPLTDCNGRLGRLILAEQMRRCLALSPHLTLSRLSFRNEEYRAVFAATTESAQFHQMCQLLGAIAEMAISAPDQPPFELGPMFPEVDPPRLFAIRHNANKPSVAPPDRFARRKLATALPDRRGNR